MAKKPLRKGFAQRFFWNPFAKRFLWRKFGRFLRFA
jgi:hypothetical protein